MGNRDFQYLNAICKAHKPFTREEEIAVAQLVRKGDKRAVEKMAAHNVALVISIVRKYSHGEHNAKKGHQSTTSARMDDLIQEGMIGLLRAINRFDPDKGNRFSTYATWWIRAYITKALKGSEGPALIKRGLPCASIDDLIHNGTGQTLGDTIAAPNSSQIKDLTEADFQQRVQEHLEKVRPQSGKKSKIQLRGRASVGQVGWAVVTERLATDSPRTLQEIGDEHGVSRERVRQIEVKVRAFLKVYLAAINDENQLSE